MRTIGKIPKIALAKPIGSATVITTSVLTIKTNMFDFDANGTEGLEAFTWIVAALIGIVAAITFTHFLSVNEEEKKDEAPLDGDQTTK